MIPFDRFPADCPVCESRGVIPLDDADRTLACPRCNSWCDFCRELYPTGEWKHPQRGVLIAGARRTRLGDQLWEGHACDFHKGRLRSYSFTAPSMIGRFRLGDVYIAVQWHTIFVSRYGYGEVKNWQELEDKARQVVVAQRRPRYRGWGVPAALYDCPPALAARAARSE